MSPATSSLWEWVIRHLKGIIRALEDWVATTD
jgi:hypothetical protein